MAPFPTNPALKVDDSQMMVEDQDMDVEGTTVLHDNGQSFVKMEHNFGHTGQDFKQAGQMKKICQRCMNGEPGHYNHLR